MIWRPISISVTNLKRCRGDQWTIRDFDWTPVRYIHRAVERDRLAALYRGSKIGLVTPLRDGMNLVAKEYVAAQDEADPAFSFCRALRAPRGPAGALIVNPTTSTK